MKQLLSLLILALCSMTAFGQWDYMDRRVLSPDFKFESGSKELMYGDNVVLRKSPSVEGKALDTLVIGEVVTIVKRMEETHPVNGLESHWYKVKHGKYTGYVLGGLIALDSKRIDKKTYLVIYAGGAEEYNLKARCRVLNSDGEYYGKEINLNTSLFYIDVHGSKGLDGIENMLTINLMAEACGVDGGITYLFDNGERLIRAIHAASVGDGGFWFEEQLIFPEDKDGHEGIVRYTREVGEPMNDEMTWTRSVQHEVILTLENEKFSPDVSELDFGDE